MISREQRAQAIAFLRSLKQSDKGVTIYQDVVDAVLSEVDEQAEELIARREDDKALAAYFEFHGARARDRRLPGGRHVPVPVQRDRRA